MSLTTHLLLNKPITLPTGIAAFHCMDKKPVRYPTPRQSDNMSRMESIRLANVERVFNAVKNGIGTKDEIAARVKLTDTTVLHALHFLADHQRVTCSKVGRKHVYGAAPCP